MLSSQTSLLPDDGLPAPAALARGAALSAAPGRFDELRGRVAASPDPLAADGRAAAFQSQTQTQHQNQNQSLRTDAGQDAAPGAFTSPSQSQSQSSLAVPDHGLAPAWSRFFASTGLAGWADLAHTRSRIARRVQDDGVTYNVYGDGVGRAHDWPLEPLPLLLSPADWAGIEAGVRQRARLLDGVLADLYGPRRLLDEGLLPAALVLAHPQYLRPLHGVQPPGGVHLHVAAFDLARLADGRWRVVGQKTQAPSGLGYLLENRLIIAPQFPDAFRDLRVQRIGAAFQTLLQGLSRLSPAGDRSRVVLLTPGPHNETYFEHAFLARYLGITLVEGGDLTVRGERLYLKTLHGLEPVHVVLRRVDDDYLDPLELRPDSALGVPGLLQALRAGQVVVANTPGAGVLESPGLSAFWPGIARRLLDEDLQLPAVTHWWCGEASVWASQRAQLDDFAVVPSFPDSATTRSFAPLLPAELPAAERAALLARIDADPAAHTLQARVRPSELPVWQAGSLEPRPAVLRVFAVTDGRGGWKVIPGGLTRVAARREGIADAGLSMQRGSTSVDTWVLTDGPVDTTSLLPPPLKAEDLAGSRRTVTSRAAENLFWLGRYTERAENAVRLARLTLETVGTAGAEPLLDTLGQLARNNGLVGLGVPSPRQSQRVFERSLVHALADRNAGSVAFTLGALRQCAQALRERLSPEHWKLIHEADDHFVQHLGAVLREGDAVEPLSDVLGVLARAATHLAAITGAQTDRMTRDDGWRLLSAGRQVERLDFLTHALSLGFAQGLPARDDGFALLLDLFDSTITYRAQFQARREVPPLLHLLVMDRDNPRALAWVARTLRDRLRKLALADSAWAERVQAGLPQPQDWSLAALCQVDAEGRHTAITAALEDLGRGTRSVSAAISQRLFAHVGPVDQTIWQ